MLLFGKSAFLDRDIEAWHFETWAWLLRNLGRDGFAHTPLVLPTRDFFSPTKATGHERALHAFDCVKAAMGMTKWPCELVVDEGPPGAQEVGEFSLYRRLAGPLERSPRRMAWRRSCTRPTW